MDKLDKLLLGVATVGLMTTATYINTKRTNKKLTMSARLVEAVACQVRDAVRKCIVPVQRGGRKIEAVAITTPALADQFRR